MGFLDAFKAVCGLLTAPYYHEVRPVAATVASFSLSRA
jgi:hypothetical protein